MFKISNRYIFQHENVDIHYKISVVNYLSDIRMEQSETDPLVKLAVECKGDISEVKWFVNDNNPHSNFTTQDTIALVKNIKTNYENLLKMARQSYKVMIKECEKGIEINLYSFDVIQYTILIPQFSAKSILSFPYRSHANALMLGGKLNITSHKDCVIVSDGVVDIYMSNIDFEYLLLLLKKSLT